MVLCSTVGKIFLLVGAVLSFVLSIVAVFIPYFTNSSATSKETVPFAYQKTKVTMTLWNITSETVKDVHYDIKSEYYSCSEGARLLQGAEGCAVMAVVLTFANIILSSFMFSIKKVVKWPLMVYQFFAMIAGICAAAIMLVQYNVGWCNMPSLSKDDWKVSGGAPLGIVSAVICFACAIGTIFA